LQTIPSYFFDILPYSPWLVPSPKVDLDIDWDDFAHQLQALYPTGEIRRGTFVDGTAFLDLIISIESQPSRVMAVFTEADSNFSVRLWPKRLAKEIVLWYRHYIPLSYPLFAFILEYGQVTELKTDLTLDDIEKMYPFPMADD
jgi:hypothetical protein